MEGVSRERAANAGHAARALGRDVRQPRFTAGQLRGDGREIDIMMLPTRPAPPLQNGAGAFHFMFGYSTWGGPDTFGGSA